MMPQLRFAPRMLSWNEVPGKGNHPVVPSIRKVKFDWMRGRGEGRERSRENNLDINCVGNALNPLNTSQIWLTYPDPYIRFLPFFGYIRTRYNCGGVRIIVCSSSLIRLVIQIRDHPSDFTSSSLMDFPQWKPSLSTCATFQEPRGRFQVGFHYFHLEPFRTFRT